MSSIGRLFGIRNAFNRTRSVSPNPTNETASCEHRPVIQKQHINRMERTVSEPHRISLRISPPKLISDDAFDNAQAIINYLDISVNNNFETCSDNNGETEIDGNIGQPHSNSDNNETDSEFSLAPECPMNENEISLYQIDATLKLSGINEMEAIEMKTIVTKMHDRILTIEQYYKGKMKEMIQAQNSSFADLLIDKRDEIEKLQAQAEDLKLNLKEATERIEVFKDEIWHLNKLSQEKDDEINQLTYELIEADKYIGSLEKEKSFSEQAIPSEEIKSHFKIIRKALLTDERMRKLLQTKKPELTDLN